MMAPHWTCWYPDEAGGTRVAALVAGLVSRIDRAVRTALQQALPSAGPSRERLLRTAISHILVPRTGNANQTSPLTFDLKAKRSERSL